MSRESLGITEPGVDDDPRGAALRRAPGRVDGGPGGPGGTGELDGTGTPTAPRPPGQGTLRRVLPVAAVVAALLVGALGGATSARQQAQGRLDAAARVVLSVEVEGGPAVDVSTAPVQGDTLVLVTASLSGEVEGVTGGRLERVRTRMGVFDVFPPVEISDGGTAHRTLLKGRPDCAPARALGQGSVDGRLLAGAVAVVRPTGTLHTVDVPVLVANPGTTLNAVAERCAPPPPPGALTGDVVRDMAASADGTVTFVVSPAGGTPPDAARQALFSLVRFDSGGLAALRPVRSDARSSTFEIPDSRFSVTVTPRLPFAVTAPTRVRLTFRTPCPSGSAILPTVSGEVTAGTVNPGGQIVPADGWDGEAFAAGATAAAVRSCTRR